MKLSIATYATPAIMNVINAHVKRLHKLELEASYPITDIISTDGVDLDHPTFATEVLEKAIAGIEKPVFHNLGISLFEGETCYGEALGYSIKSSSGNTMFLAVCDYDSKDPIIVLSYNGSRGGLDYLLCGNSPLDANLVKELVNDPEDDILVYETEGPTDMYFWETKATYTIRKGGVTQLKEVREIVKKLANNTLYSVSEYLTYGQMDGEEMNTHHYTWASVLGTNDNIILLHWINDSDLAVREQRVEQIRNITSAYKLAQALTDAL